MPKKCRVVPVQHSRSATVLQTHTAGVGWLADWLYCHDIHDSRATCKRRPTRPNLLSCSIQTSEYVVRAVTRPSAVPATLAAVMHWHISCHSGSVGEQPGMLDEQRSSWRLRLAIEINLPSYSAGVSCVLSGRMNSPTASCTSLFAGKDQC